MQVELERTLTPQVSDEGSSPSGDTMYYIVRENIFLDQKFKNRFYVIMQKNTDIESGEEILRGKKYFCSTREAIAELKKQCPNIRRLNRSKYNLPPQETYIFSD